MRGTGRRGKGAAAWLAAARDWAVLTGASDSREAEGAAAASGPLTTVSFPLDQKEGTVTISRSPQENKIKQTFT